MNFPIILSKFHLNFVSNENGILFPTNQIGIFIRAKGEAQEKIQCLTTSVKPREIEHCTADLPVLYKGENFYLTPINRILTKATSIQPCSKLGAPEFKTISGKWITAVPDMSFTSSPKVISEISLETMDQHFSQGGIYSDDDLAQYANHILFPKQQKVIYLIIS